MKVLIGAKVEPSLKVALQTLAAKNERTVSQEIRRALHAHLNGDDASASALLPEPQISACR